MSDPSIPLVVYLAGGMRSGWQDEVKADVPELRYLDPRIHGFTEPKEYTLWDLSAISRSDLLFAYLEKDNPSGVGLALEVGYAKAIGVRVIFVEEPGNPLQRNFGMVRSESDIALDDLKEGIRILKQFQEF